MATDLTDAELQQLLSEGLTPTAIAHRTGIPRLTLRRRIAELDVAHVDTGVSTEGISNVYDSTQISKHAIETGDTELQELLAWWRERKRALQVEGDTEQETQQQTYHVQKRYIEAIQRAADLEHVSIMEIVNRAFGYYFNREHN